MTAGPRVHHVLIVEPDARVRRALVDLVESAGGFCVLAAMAELDGALCSRTDVALVSVRRGSDAGFAAVRRLAHQVPVVAVASVGSLAGRAIAAGAAVFYDQDGDADALVAVLRDVVGCTH